jgi:hypothetical protein
MRPTKLTLDRQEKLIQAIKAGNTLVSACAYAGIHYSNFRRWMIEGETGESKLYCEFREAVLRAEAELEVALVSRWLSASKTNWRAAAEFLARRFPDRWSPSLQVNVQVEQRVEVELNLFCQAIAEDSEIPHDVKTRIFQKAAELSD